METGDKCKVTNFIGHLNIHHEQLSAKSSILIKQSILYLLRTLIFSDPAREVSLKSHIPIKDFHAFTHSIEKKVVTYCVPGCYSCVHNSESLLLLQNLPAGMCQSPCGYFLWKPRNWYGNCFISRSSPDMELTC